MKHNKFICWIFRFLYCIYPYRLALFFNKIGQVFYTYWIRNAFGSFGEGTLIEGRFLKLVGPQNMHIGNNCNIGINIVMETYERIREQKFNPRFELGNNSSIGNESHITCINSIKIGNDVRMGRKVFITDNAHGASESSLLDISPAMRPLYSKGSVVIEDCVWIGEMVSIMPGVTIGRGSIIGANSVITKNIPPYCMAAGNPAKVIKQIR